MGIYASYTNVVSSGQTIKTIITFTATATPTISNYQTSYKTLHGQYPQARLMYIDEDGNWNEWMQQPKFNTIAGVVDSITWDLAEALTGFIILS
jgi:hypothetical protein